MSFQSSQKTPMLCHQDMSSKVVTCLHDMPRHSHFVCEKSAKMSQHVRHLLKCRENVVACLIAPHVDICVQMSHDIRPHLSFGSNVMSQRHVTNMLPTHPTKGTSKTKFALSFDFFKMRFKIDRRAAVARFFCSSGSHKVLE